MGFGAYWHISTAASAPFHPQTSTTQDKRMYRLIPDTYRAFMSLHFTMLDSLSSKEIVAFDLLVGRRSAKVPRQSSTRSDVRDIPINSKRLQQNNSVIVIISPSLPLQRDPCLGDPTPQVTHFGSFSTYPYSS